MNVHDEIRSALSELEYALDTASTASASVNQQGGKLSDTLLDFSEVRENNFNESTAELKQTGNQIRKDIQVVKANQVDIDAQFCQLHEQEHKTLILLKWRFRQAQRPLKKQHMQHLRGIEDICLSLSHYEYNMSESFEKEYNLLSKHVKRDQSEIEISQNTVQKLDTMRELSHAQEQLIRESYVRMQRQKAIQLNDMGAKSLSVGLYYEAIYMLTQAADICPEESAIRINLGWAYLMAGRSVDARDETMKAIDISGTSVEIYYLLGHVELMEQNAEEAIQTLTKAKELAPDSEKILLALGLAYIANGEYHTGLDLLGNISSESVIFETYPLLAP